MYNLQLLAAKECLPTHIHTRSLLTRPQFIGRLLGEKYIYIFKLLDCMERLSKGQYTLFEMAFMMTTCPH